MSVERAPSYNAGKPVSVSGTDYEVYNERDWFLMKIKNEESVMYGSAIKIADGTMPHRVVLRKVEDSYQPYVTHYENMRLEDGGNTWVHDSFYWGHYFSSKDDAVKDYEERSARF